jgi:pimeloyl-ACP methyl ester carboxylesterase
LPAGGTLWSQRSTRSDASAYAKKFSGKYSHRIIPGGIGHNLPQEAPQAFAKAVVEVDGY